MSQILNVIKSVLLLDSTDIPATDIVIKKDLIKNKILQETGITVNETFWNSRKFEFYSLKTLTSGKVNVFYGDDVVTTGKLPAIILSFVVDQKTGSHSQGCTWTGTLSVKVVALEIDLINIYKRIYMLLMSEIPLQACVNNGLNMFAILGTPFNVNCWRDSEPTMSFQLKIIGISPVITSDAEVLML